MRILLLSNTAWSVLNFRMGLLRALAADGHEVIAAAPSDRYAERIEAEGIPFRPVPMDRRGKNPVRDLGLLLRLRRLFRALRPDAVLLFTIKPNLYGSLAAASLGIPAICNVTGLGEAFSRRSPLNALVRLLYRAAFRSPRRVFFQNDDDMRTVLDAGLLASGRARLLPGSGVDMERFRPDESAATADSLAGDAAHAVRFLLMARLLREKGVREYAEAARVVRREFPQAEFLLAGAYENPGPAAILPGEVAVWQREGILRYLGFLDDARSAIAAVDCVVLPSYYREGVPRSLLEAAAMGKPLITTDRPGCRRAVEDGMTGFLCRPRDAADLAGAFRRLLALSAAERAAMGLQGREKMRREFDERIVIDAYRDELVRLHDTRAVPETPARAGDRRA